MANPCLLLLLLLLLLTITCFCDNTGFSSPQVSYLLDCGASSDSTVDGRLWRSDSDSGLVSTSKDILAVASASNGSDLSNAAIAGSLLQTARIFVQESSYTFPVSDRGRLWLRLHFYPFGFEGYDPSLARFSVSANGLVLLWNISVIDALNGSDSLSSPYLFKEYALVVTGKTGLKLTFLPENGVGSYAFVNAIEVVSMPASVIPEQALPLGGKEPIYLDFEETMAVQSVHRVNVGGALVSSANDTLGRTWQANETGLLSKVGVQSIVSDPGAVQYTSLAPPYLAPRKVLSTAVAMDLPDATVTDPTFNITWTFPVQLSHPYIVRLFFCEIVYTSISQRIFNVYIQNQTVFDGLDIIQAATTSETIYFLDIYLNATQSGDTLWIQIGSAINAGVDDSEGILNGLEIWKLSDEKRSLDTGSGARLVRNPGRSKSWTVFGAVMGVLAVLAALLLAGVCCFCQPKAKLVEPVKTMGKRASMTTAGGGWFTSFPTGGNSVSMVSKVSTTAGSYVSSVPSNLGRCFSFAEIQEVTKNFEESQLLGVGGFGKVYKGEMDDGTEVAVKRGNPRSEQGMTEFQTEIEMLSKLRHRHLVSLIGYCDENREMILVYEYMANGPLRAHLYGSPSPPLSWKQRIEVCIGAARGLHYLHTGGAAQGIIHRDVKTTNILLDENFVAKVADFGLSKTGPSLDRTHVSTAVKGSFGYLDPEYFRRQQLTEKSDVYSFGVVLLEVVCARPAINPSLPRDQVNIAEWGMTWQKKGRLDQIIDSRLAGSIHPEALKKYGEIAQKCLADQGIDRPSMGDVLWNLEYIFQIQETASATLTKDSDASRNSLMELPIHISNMQQWNHDDDDDPPLQQNADIHRHNNNNNNNNNNNIHSSSNKQEKEEDASASLVFSQILKPKGR